MGPRGRKFRSSVLSVVGYVGSGLLQALAVNVRMLLGGAAADTK